MHKFEIETFYNRRVIPSINILLGVNDNKSPPNARFTEWNSNLLYDKNDTLKIKIWLNSRLISESFEEQKSFLFCFFYFFA